MKHALMLLAGLVVGFLLGGFGPRQALLQEREKASELRDQVLRLERKLARRGSNPFGALPGLDRASRDEDWEEDAEEEVAAPAPEPDRTGGEPEVNVVVGESGGGYDSLARFDKAVEAQQLRIDQSRSALQQQAGLGDDTMDQVDAVARHMNEELSAYADELLDMALSGEEPTSRELLGLTHDVTGILYDSQVAMEEAVAAGGGDLANVEEEALAAWNYVDLDYFRDAVEQAEAAGPGPGGRGAVHP